MPVTQRHLLQLKVTLRDVSPPIWRRILLPVTYTFWDLHVAIQSAMGWWDSHLHAFRLGQDVAGIPTEFDFDDDKTLPGWEFPIKDYFKRPGDTVVYDYDFGDDWQHEIVLENAVLREKGARYPKCIGGERACPPEDWGGVHGYAHLLAVLADAHHEEHATMREWVGGAYDAAHFDATAVRYLNPKRRWQEVFADKN